MQRIQAQSPRQNLEMNLREQLLAAGASGSAPVYPPPPSAGHQGPEHPYQPADPASPHDHLSPNVAGGQAPYAQMSGDSAGDDDLGLPGGKGKRELSTSKRAAQNRAAQRAFRQRKELYIKKLQDELKDFQTMEQNYRALQNENYQLREYILNLQSRLLETKHDYPPAPFHINLASSSAPPQSTNASAVSGLVPSQEQPSRELPQLAQSSETSRTDESYRNQLQAAAAQDDDVRPQRESPYGLGTEYPSKRQRKEESIPVASGMDHAH